MSEYRFDFANEQQFTLYEKFREELRRLPWESIRAAVREKGEYRLGLTRELQPVYPADPSLDTVSERDQRAAWLFALAQTVLQEQHFSLAHRADPESGEDALWVTAPFGAAWRTAPRLLWRSTAKRRRCG
jgi:hypothetical protein